MDQANEWRVEPVTAIEGSLHVPGDKSISHRAAMLCSLARGRSTIDGFLRSEDCLNTLNAVSVLGADVEWEEGLLHVSGVGGRWQGPPGALEMGNSGTGMRLLAGLLAGHPFCSTMIGDASLCSRPMSRIRQPLVAMGAAVDLTEAATAPISIHGGALNGMDYALPMASAQVKSCVLLAGLFAEGDTVVVEPKPTRDHTERLLKAMGAPLTVDGLRIRVAGTAGAPLALCARDLVVPGDASSAAFWLAASACRPGGKVTIESMGVNPRRTAFLDVLRRMGADVTIENEKDADWEPRADVTVTGGALQGTVVCGEEIPNLIDELPLVFVLGAFAKGETVVKDAKELRVKESDRIAEMARSLRTAGVDLEVHDDGMTVRGGSVAGGCGVQSGGDHRIAMAMAILALGAEAAVTIQGTACVATSYPGFIEDLMKVVKA